MMSSRLFFLLAGMTVVTLTSPAAAQLDFGSQFGTGGGGAEGGEVEFSGSFQLTEGSLDGVLSITAKIAPKWHIYSTTQLKGGPRKSELTFVKSQEVESVGKFSPDHDPHVHTPTFDDGKPIFPVASEEFQDKVTWTAPIRLAPGTDPSNVTMTIIYDGQVCAEADEGGACINIDERSIEAEFAGYIKVTTPSGEYRAENSHALIKGHIEPSVVKPGDTVNIVLTAEMDEDWHIYHFATQKDEDSSNVPTLIGLTKTNQWPAKTPVASAEPKIHEQGGKQLLPYHEDEVTWTIKVQVPREAEEGNYTLRGLMVYQTCTIACDAPTAATFEGSVTVGPDSVGGQSPLEFQATGFRKAIGTATSMEWSDGTTFELGQLHIYLGAAFLAGLILNVMPCVLPVIGLKIMSFVHQAGQSRGRIIALNLWYTLGMLMVFWSIGIAAVALRLTQNGKLSWAEQFQYPAFSITLTSVVFVFGLSLFGVWEIPIPGFVGSGKADAIASKEGPIGAFFKGVLATLLATPCTGPFLGVAVAFAIAAPPWITFLCFTAMGLGMASPYLVIGMFPGLAKALPKPGPWMETFKQLMGFVLMGTVVFCLGFVGDKYLTSTMVLLMGLAMACWIVGRISVSATFNEKVRSWAFGGFVATLFGLFGFFVIISPYELNWQPYSRVTLDEHVEKGHTVLVDFTADW